MMTPDDFCGHINRLVREIRQIAEYGCLPDGDHVNTPTAIWAERWAEQLDGEEEREVRE